MNTSLWANNLAIYSLQIGLVIGLAAFVPTLLRLRSPGARLAYWQFLLIACLLLPWLAPRQSQLIVVSSPTPVATSPTRFTTATDPVPDGRSYSRTDFALALLAAGVLGRLAWLGVGLFRLRRYRKHSVRLVPPPSWSVEADLRVSEYVSSPVTFGVRKPVVLLPADFTELDPLKQDAVLAHECLHVRRRDWLYTMVEEGVRAVFWFHPAVWWLLAEIQLAREQAVDRAAVEITKARGEYVDALLAIAGAKPSLDLAPAPLFLRKRHLKKRVVSLLKEVQMSKTRLASAMAISLCLMAGACWIIAGSLPLTAAPQVVADAPGVTVDTGSATLLHRSAVSYPADAKAARVQGMVVMDVTLDSSGSVNNMRVLGGPEQLRRAVMQSVLQWHFTADSAGKTRQISVNFQLPPEAAPQAPTAVAQVAGTAADETRVIRSITVAGLPESAKTQLISSLQVHEGDSVNMRELLRTLPSAVKQFDEHLNVAFLGLVSPTGGPAEIGVAISAPGSAPLAGQAAGQAVRVVSVGSLPAAGSGAGAQAAAGVLGGILSAAPSAPASGSGGVLGGVLASAPATRQSDDAPADGPQRIRVGGNVQQARLISQPKPIYPPLAKQARISGSVTFNVIIATDGTVKNMDVVSGHPLLVSAAIEAVRQWIYQPTLLNGNPVEVVTQVVVNFTLSDEPPSAM